MISEGKREGRKKLSDRMTEGAEWDAGVLIRRGEHVRALELEDLSPHAKSGNAIYQIQF
jgi:hypothetical protein